MSKVSDTTRAICQMYAEGTRPKVIAETLQVDILKVYKARKLYPDLIAEYRGKNMDGTPLGYCFNVLYRGMQGTKLVMRHKTEDVFLQNGKRSYRSMEQERE